MAEKSGKRWWLLGCLALIGVGVVALAAVGATVAIALRSETIVRDVRTPDVPSLDAGPPPSVRSLRTDSPSRPSAAPPSSERSGTVVLDAGGGEVYLEPALAGEPLQIEARYDESYYRLDERLEGREHWTYDLRFRLTRSAFLTGIKEAIGGSQPRIRIRLPRDLPLELHVLMKNGAATVDLGGLWLTAADFEIDGALLKLGASAPLPFPVEQVAVHGSKGGLFLEGLSLINPRRLDVDFGFGGAQLDLRGSWTADSAIDIATRMSDVVLILPRGARIEGLETNRPLSPGDTEVEPPTLRFSVETGTRGKVEVFE